MYSLTLVHQPRRAAFVAVAFVNPDGSELIRPVRAGTPERQFEWWARQTASPREAVEHGRKRPPVKIAPRRSTNNGVVYAAAGITPPERSVMHWRDPYQRSWKKYRDTRYKPH